MRVLIVLGLLLCAGCSQHSLLTKQDYEKSQRHFLRGEDEEAQLDLPRGSEDGTFITTMEKGYLSLIQNKPDIQGLKKQAALQENQVRYHVSREARTFFYVQTPEDYYPSEHEVIWLHLLLSWGYSQQGMYTDACVEARVASSLLTLPWAPTGHFDDPAMRLFLAGLWTMCGEWHEAQVDLRAAWVMDHSLGWARDLADREHPPRQLFIVLGGPGPEVVWDPELAANPLRSARQVRFKLRGRKSALSTTDAGGVHIPVNLSPDAGKWYERHLARESELHELIQDSSYGGRAAASGAKAAAIVTGSTGVGVVQGVVVGALVGVALVAEYGGGATLSDYEVVAAVGAVVGGIVGGIHGAVEGYQKGAAEVKKDMDPSPGYRFVRYLPEYLWVGWSDQEIAYPVKLSTAHDTVTIRAPTVAAKGTAVTIAHLSDSSPPSCSYRLDGGPTTLVTAPDAQGNCPAAPDY